MIQLTPTEARVLGVLVEKQAATPDVYPLTLNAIVAGANQKSSRNPVMHLHPGDVEHTLKLLEARELVRRVEGGRATRWEHRMDKAFDVSPAQRALLALLFLRGAQTASELQGRAEKLHRFETVAGVHQELEALRHKDYVAQVPRQPGQRETRYVHLLSGEPEAPPGRPTPDRSPPPPDLETRLRALEDRIAELERRMESKT